MSDTTYMKFGDVEYNMDIIPTDENGKPEQLAPMAGILDLFKKKEAQTTKTSKVYINGNLSDLYVIRLSADEYYKKLIDNDISSNTFYVLDNDVVNAYGQNITNVAEPIDDSDAATKKYVDDKLDAIREKAKSLNQLDANATSNQVLQTVNTIVDMLKSI